MVSRYLLATSFISNLSNCYKILMRKIYSRKIKRKPDFGSKSINYKDVLIVLIFLVITIFIIINYLN